jgi:SAM-dependent methyltransferase
MDDFWNDKHENKNTYWISSAYSGKDILDIHKLNINDIKNKSVLDIGIGAGNLIKYFYDNNNKVYACDISIKALENVEKLAETYTTNNLKNIPPVDIAISNLVFQHCDNDEIERLINEVNLKEGGIFSFQFAYLRENEEPNQFVKSLMDNKTHFFRSKKQMLDIINASNKKVVNVLDDIHYYGEENFSWSIMVITNKT